MGSRAIVLGAGKSGLAAAAILRQGGIAVTVLNGDAPFPEGDFSMAVVSPGIALSHPWIAEAKRRGVPLKSELQLGCEELKRRGWKLLAVTGSKGKSSVVKVVAEAINLAGMKAVACGNYGTPVCEVANNQTIEQSNKSSWAVVEVSSFMMETTELPPDTFEAAVILNLQEDHLDRHGSVEVYHALKRKLLKMAKEPLDLEHMGEDGGEYLAKSYFDNEVLRANGIAAIALMKAAKLDAKAIRGAFQGFEPLPHRMNLVATVGGVRYFDDSKATSIAALAAGVKMASKGPPWQRIIRLIAGGLPKGDDPKTALPVLTERVKKVYLIGQSAAAFSAAWSGEVDCEICETLDLAMAAVRCEAEKGETVLLSPGAASFDQFKSFEERGDAFARLVKKEGS